MEGLYEKATQLSRVGIWEWNPVTNETFWHGNKYRLFGYEPNEFEITIDSAFKTVHPDDVNHIFQILKEKLPKEDVFDYEYRGIKKDGTEICVWVRIEVERNEKGDPIKITGISQDITNRKQLENNIKELNSDLELKVQERTKELEQKNTEIELLLKELHHRVKNNLMVSASLLNLQINENSNTEVVQALKTASQRIKTIGLLHKVILGTDKSNNLSAIKYFEMLFASIVESTGRMVNVEVNANFDFISLDKLTHLGLIMNELCMNSMKHAFTNGEVGQIVFEMKSLKDSIEITYNDGSNLKNRKVAKSNDTGLGSFLIQGLIYEQLEGTLSYILDSNNILIKIPN